MNITNINDHKVTLGLKVTKQQKEETRLIAASNGMNVSQYLSALLLQSNDKINQFIDLPDELIITTEKSDAILKLIHIIQQQFPKRNSSEIMLAALKVALKNQNLITRNQLKNHLS